MFNLTGMAEQARFLCVLGYQRETTMASLAVAFPRATREELQAAWDDAVAQQRESERQLDKAVARDDRRAVDAEHDLGKTMHKGD